MERLSWSQSPHSEQMTCSSSSAEAGGDSRTNSSLCSAFQHDPSPLLLSGLLQKSCSTTSPAVWSKSTPSSRYICTCVYVPKINKNSIKPEEDLSVIRHTCRQLATATIAIRSQQPQIVFLKHQAAATLMPSGLSSETALIAGIPSLGICVRAATRCANLTTSQVHSGVPRGLSACRQAAGFFSQKKSTKW